jgi:dihydropteroate synthase
VVQRVWNEWKVTFGERCLDVGRQTLVMGILNVTPDSFSDGGQFTSLEVAVARARQMLIEGADIIDVGGESTRPGSVPLSAEEELTRVIPVIKGIRAVAPNAIISIDTYKAVVADAAVTAGANLVNDVWGLQGDERMASIVARHQVPVIVMHNQIGTVYRDLIKDVVDFLRRSIKKAVQAGISADRVLIDPGIGFGKSSAQNLEVLDRLAELQELGRPILLGFSRKRTIGNVLGGLPANERLEGTAATVALGIDRGADIVRVHDVLSMKRVALMTDAVVRPGRGGFTEPSS